MKTIIIRPIRGALSYVRLNHSSYALLCLISLLNCAGLLASAQTCDEKCDAQQVADDKAAQDEKSLKYLTALNTHTTAVKNCQKIFDSAKIQCETTQLAQVDKCKTDWSDASCTTKYDEAVAKADLDHVNDVYKCFGDAACLCAANAKWPYQKSLALNEKTRCVAEKASGLTKCIADAAAAEKECVSLQTVAQAKCVAQADLAQTLSQKAADETLRSKTAKDANAALHCHAGCNPPITCPQQCGLDAADRDLACSEIQAKSVYDADVTKTTKKANDLMEATETIGKAAATQVKTIQNARDQGTYDRAVCSQTKAKAYSDAEAAYTQKIACCGNDPSCPLKAESDKTTAQLKADIDYSGLDGNGGCVGAATKKESDAVINANKAYLAAEAAAQLLQKTKDEAADAEYQTAVDNAALVFSKCEEDSAAKTADCLKKCPGA